MEITKEEYDEVVTKLTERPMIQVLIEEDKRPLEFMVKMAIICGELRQAIFEKEEERCDA